MELFVIPITRILDKIDRIDEASNWSVENGQIKLTGTTGQTGGFRTHRRYETEEKLTKVAANTVLTHFALHFSTVFPHL